MALPGILLFRFLKTVVIGMPGTAFHLYHRGVLNAAGFVLKSTGADGCREVLGVADQDIILAGIVQGSAIIPGISRF